jgi:hypothetical protein
MSRKLKRYFKPLAATALLSGVAVVGLHYLMPPPEPVSVSVEDVPYYQLPWNDDPFYPSNMKTANGPFVKPEKLPSAASCVQCHVNEFEEWAASLHSVAGRDAVYDKTIDYNEHFDGKTGPERIRFCEACHEPAEMVIGAVNRVKSVLPTDATTEGLTCIICHAVTEAHPEVGNGAFTVDLALGRDHTHNALIMASPRDHARAFGAKATKGLITKSDFCGACHEENYHPGNSKVQGMAHVQTTYREWKESWYAEQGVTCQDCHMNYDPVGFIDRLKEGVVERPEKYSHAFAGANYLLTETDLGSNIFFLRGGVLPGLTGERYLQILERQKKLTHDFLRTAAEVEVRQMDLKPGSDGVLKVAVKNVGAGHNLPTGVGDQKHMWLEVQVEDADGQVVFHSGAFDEEKGRIAPGSVVWAERFFDRHGERIMDHLTFNTAKVDFTRPFIPARGEDVVEYAVALPAGARGPFRVRAKLWYRVAFQEFVQQILKTTLVIPPFLLAETEQLVNADREVAAR